AYAKRIEEMKQALKRVSDLLSKIDSSNGLADKFKSADYSKLAPVAKKKVLDDRQKIVDNLRGKLEQSEGLCNGIADRMKTIPREIADYPQIKSALTEIAKGIDGYRKNFPTWRKNLDDGEKAVAELR